MNAPRRVVIADDEPLARERLRMLLARHPQYVVAAECEDGRQAVDAVLRERPDVLFLDIRMPELSGIEVAEALEQGDGPAPAIVFVTAFDAYALRAIELHALDYLLKPADHDGLARALARVEERLARRATGPDAPALDPALRAFLDDLRAERAYPRRFLVRDAKGGLYFVQAADVDWVDAEGNYVGLWVAGRRHLVRDTMKAFEGKLDPARFVRVHRGAIVNLDRVARLEPLSHGEYTITLKDGTRLRTSRAHGTRLMELLS